MKQFLFAALYIFLLAACSPYNQIHTSEKNGLHSMSLFQTPKADLLQVNMESKELSGIKLDTRYLYEQEGKHRPTIVLDLMVEKPYNGMADSLFFITLDGEFIQLSASKGKSVIPENLWVPIVHSQNIQYQLNMNHDVIVLKLNEKQKKLLIEFFNKAINYRDDIFPAIPEGQKKW